MTDIGTAHTKAESSSEAARNPELSLVDRRVRDFAQEYPFMTVGLAVAAGYFFGRLISRL